MAAKKRVRLSRVLLIVAAVNALLIIVGLWPSYSWKPIPSDPELSKATFLAAMQIADIANLLFIPLIGLLGAAMVAVAFETRPRRLIPGACPSCGYDRAGLAQGAACPECGKAIPTKEGTGTAP